MSEALLSVRVTPGCSRAELTVGESQVIARITQSPTENQANIGLIHLLCDRLGIAKSRISIHRGNKSRNKVVAFAGITQQELDSIVQEKLK